MVWGLAHYGRLQRLSQIHILQICLHTSKRPCPNQAREKLQCGPASGWSTDCLSLAVAEGILRRKPEMEKALAKGAELPSGYTEAPFQRDKTVPYLLPMENMAMSPKQKCSHPSTVGTMV